MGLQEIFNNLHNTNLAKEEFEKTNLTIHKAELAAKNATEFKKEAEQIYYKAKKEAEAEILSASSKMEDSHKRLRKLQAEIDKIFQRFDKMAKELGIDIRSSKVGKTYLKAAEEITDYQIKAQTSESKLKNFKF